MCRTLCLFVLLLLLATTPLAATAQQPAPTANPADDLLAAWNREAKKLVDMAEDFPEEKYSYKPTPEVRSFAEQLAHVAEANLRFARLSRGEAPGGTPEHSSEAGTKAEIVALLKKSFADGAELIRQAGETGLNQTIQLPNRTLSRYGLWTAAVVNAAEHYGNLVVYYRLNGLVPPTTRAAQERHRPR
ncbi:MAG: DinB family protein [Acidobacteria bacterium]|nr:DinB family protein [Acidobacteriota bacterium]